MNLRQHFTATCLLCLLFANTGLAQNFKRLTLRSYFPAKTVIVSNVNQELGEKSPFLVAAALKENEGQKEYRSLLQFNYDYLPDEVRKNPAMITSAELVLYPANADILANNHDEYSKLVVKRILENWSDSIIGWDNLPMVDSALVATQKVRIDRKNREIRIDVTPLLLEMLLHGNQGFMICQNNKPVANGLTGLSFASSLNEDKLIRPLLIIVYSDGTSGAPEPQQRRYRPPAPANSSPTSTGSGSNRSTE